MDRPGFTVRRIKVADDDPIELLVPNSTEDEFELAELRALLDETVEELRKTREAKNILFAQVMKLREKLDSAREEIRSREIADAIDGRLPDLTRPRPWEK